MGKNRLIRAKENETRIPTHFRFVYQGEIKGEWYRMHQDKLYRPNPNHTVIRVEFRDVTLDGKTAVKNEAGKRG